MAVAAVGVVNLPAVLQHGQAEIGVLADGVARPVAGGLDGGAAHQAHGAVRDDGIGLVAHDHADIEETGIFGVHGMMHEGAVAVAMVLRRLHDADLRIREGRDQVLEPVGMHHIVGIDDADDGGVGGGVGERQAQRAGFEPGQVVGVDELEALAERAAMLLDRQPVGRIGGIVDDHHAFEVRILQAGDGIERRLEHVRRLPVGRDMDRHLGSEPRRRRQRRP